MRLERDDHAGQIPAPEDGEKDKFPEGMRVLAVDDNSVCLRVLEAFLRQCRYRATVTTESVTALKLLRENKNHFDIVITDVHMLDMDGFKLLEIIGLEMDIPVIMMSSNDDQSTVMKGIEYGACDYLLKPIRLEEIKNIWQHVIRKTKFDTSDSNVAKVAVDRISNPNKRQNNQCREKDDANVQSDGHSSAQKRPRVAWSRELHTKFISAFEKLGPDKAVPSKLLEQMNVPGLTREKIASHLQKYRNALRKNRSQQSNIIVASNGMDERQPNTTILSFEERVPNGVNCLDDFTVNDYRNSGMIQFDHRIQSPNILSASLLKSKSLSLPPHQQNILPQQYPQAFHQSVQVRGHGNDPSNPMRMENLHHQSYLNRLKYQSFSPRNKMCKEYLDISSNIPGDNVSSEFGPSGFPLLGCASNSHPIGSSLDFAGSQCPVPNDVPKLSTIAQYDSVVRATQVLPVQHEGRNLVHMDMQSFNEEHYIGSGQMPLVDNPLEHLETDSIFLLSNCSPTDEDLNAAVKQFQQ